MGQWAQVWPGESLRISPISGRGNVIGHGSSQDAIRAEAYMAGAEAWALAYAQRWGAWRETDGGELFH